MDRVVIYPECKGIGKLIKKFSEEEIQCPMCLGTRMLKYTIFQKVGNA